MTHLGSESCFLNISSASHYQIISGIMGLIAFRFQLGMFRAHCVAQVFLVLQLISSGSGVEITLPVGVVRRLLPSTSLREALGQGRVPAQPPNQGNVKSWQAGDG